MSVENKIETGNNPDIKKLLEKKDVNWALSLLWDISIKTVENKKEEFAGLFEVAHFIKNLQENELFILEENILKKYLQPRNII